MYEYLKGTLQSASPSKVTLDCSGIGYAIFIPFSTYAKLPQIGNELTCFVSFVVREDSQKLFGFLTEEERDFFDLLHSISGIGPKTALSILGHIEIADLQLAIANNNVKLLYKLPGIGKKTAERLVLDLRDKISPSHPALPAKKQVTHDAISTLINLGYHPAIAQKTIVAILEQTESADLSFIITKALQTIK
jgi:holliday junction DNA helicase RuvA